MIKKTLSLLIVALLPVGLFAQATTATTTKIGHVNSAEITETMPEVKQMRETLEKMQTQWENELSKMREELKKKVSDFQKEEATMPESIKNAKLSEFQQLEQRINTFNQTASLDLQKKQQELTAPILEKVQKAIDAVASENGYTYIFDLSSGNIVYHSLTSNDITSLVKKKMGI